MIFFKIPAWIFLQSGRTACNFGPLCQGVLLNCCLFIRYEPLKTILCDLWHSFQLELSFLNQWWHGKIATASNYFRRFSCLICGCREKTEGAMWKRVTRTRHLPSPLIQWGKIASRGENHYSFFRYVPLNKILRDLWQSFQPRFQFVITWCNSYLPFVSQSIRNTCKTNLIGFFV